MNGPLFTYRGCFSFGPEHIQSLDIWSPTIGAQEQTIPKHLVPMNKCSQRQSVLKSGLEPFFQFFYIWWSTLDIMDDSKPI